jgi:transposase-like protein
MRMIDFDFNFVEDTFGSYEKLTIRRIRAPDNSRTAIDFHAEGSRIHEPIKTLKISRKNFVFRMLKVKIFGHLVVFS